MDSYLPDLIEDHVFTGRKKLITSLLPKNVLGNYYGATETNPETLAKDLSEQLPIHGQNSLECAYLLQYYRGDQSILRRFDENRINDNRTVLNFAHAICRNISSYTFSGGVQAVASNPGYFEDVKIYNDCMKRENKSTISKEVQDYSSICGTAFLSILPDSTMRNDVPFELRFLSPVNTFVVYSCFNHSVPVYGCTYFTLKREGKEETVYQVYTQDEVYIFRSAGLARLKDQDSLIKRENHILRAVPIVEFPNNAFRLGDFEPALTLLDGINTLSSDCLYNIQSVVTSYLCLFGVDKDDIDTDKMKENRIMVFSGVVGIQQDAKFIYTQLDGSSTQLLRNYLESALKFIVGIPDRDAGQTGSDTGVAAEMRTGQGDLEVVARTKALYAQMAERQIFEIALNILTPSFISSDIKSSDVDIEITRINRADMLTKTQSMMNMDTIGFPEDDIIYFGGITNDVAGVAERWRKNKEKMQKAQETQLKQESAKKQSTENIVVEGAV